MNHATTHGTPRDPLETAEAFLSPEGALHSMSKSDLASLCRELRELRADKERLDWLIKKESLVCGDAGGLEYYVEHGDGFRQQGYYASGRLAIDAARKEKP